MPGSPVDGNVPQWSELVIFVNARAIGKENTHWSCHWWWRNTGYSTVYKTGAQAVRIFLKWSNTCTFCPLFDTNRWDLDGFAADPALCDSEDALRQMKYPQQSKYKRSQDVSNCRPVQLAIILFGPAPFANKGNGVECRWQTWSCGSRSETAVKLHASAFEAGSWTSANILFDGWAGTWSDQWSGPDCPPPTPHTHSHRHTKSCLRYFAPHWKQELPERIWNLALPDKLQESRAFCKFFVRNFVSSDAKLAEQIDISGVREGVGVPLSVGSFRMNNERRCRCVHCASQPGQEGHEVSNCEAQLCCWTVAMLISLCLLDWPILHEECGQDPRGPKSTSSWLIC